MLTKIFTKIKECDFFIRTKNKTPNIYKDRLFEEKKKHLLFDYVVWNKKQRNE